MIISTTRGTVKNMPKTSLVKLIAAAALIFAVLVIAGSFIVTADFLEKYVTKGEPIRPQSMMGVDIFQQQLLRMGILLGAIGILLLVFHKRIWHFFATRPEVGKKLLLLLGIILLILLAGEIILRLFFARQIYAEYGHGPGFRKQVEATKLNTLGFRDVEHSLEKKGNLTRIVIIGDSFTFGLGVEDTEKIFVRVLQKKLDEQYGVGKFEVIVLAEKGFTTTDELLVLHNTALDFNPDLIVLAFFLNDAEGAGSRIGFERLYFHHYMYPWIVGGWLYEHSFLFYFFESRMKNVVRNLGLEEKSHLEYITHLYSDSNPYFERHQQHLRYFIRLAHKKGSTVVVMSIPALMDFERYPYNFVARYIKNITESEGGYFLDLLPNYAIYDFEKLKVSFTDGHLSELGHEATAEALRNFINKEVLEATANTS